MPPSANAGRVASPHPRRREGVAQLEGRTTKYRTGTSSRRPVFNRPMAAFCKRPPFPLSPAPSRTHARRRKPMSSLRRHAASARQHGPLSVRLLQPPIRPGAGASRAGRASGRPPASSASAGPYRSKRARCPRRRASGSCRSSWSSSRSSWSSRWSSSMSSAGSHPDAASGSSTIPKAALPSSCPSTARPPSSRDSASGATGRSTSSPPTSRRERNAGESARSGLTKRDTRTRSSPHRARASC